MKNRFADLSIEKILDSLWSYPQARLFIAVSLSLTFIAIAQYFIRLYFAKRKAKKTEGFLLQVVPPKYSLVELQNEQGIRFAMQKFMDNLIKPERISFETYSDKNGVKIYIWTETKQLQEDIKLNLYNIYKDRVKVEEVPADYINDFYFAPKMLEFRSFKHEIYPMMELKDFEGVDPAKDIINSMLNITDDTKLLFQVVVKPVKRDEFVRKLAEKYRRLGKTDISYMTEFFARVESYFFYFIPLLPVILGKVVPLIINAINSPKTSVASQNPSHYLNDDDPTKILILPEDFKNFKNLLDEKMKSTYATYIRVIATGDSKNEKLKLVEQAMVTLKSENQNRFIARHSKKFTNLYSRFIYPESKIFPFFRNIFTSQRTMSSRELSMIFHLSAQNENPLIQSYVMPQIPAKDTFTTSKANSDLFVGINTYRNEDKEVYLSEENRKRHLVVTGQTGTGKSTILKNFVLKDIDERFNKDEKRGLMLLDPHEDFFMDILKKTKDISDIDKFISWDTRSEKRYFGFNPLYAVGMSEREIDLVIDANYKLIEKLIKKANPELGMGTTGKAMLMNGMKTLMVLQNDWLEDHNTPANLQKMKEFAPSLVDLKSLFTDGVYPKIKETLKLERYQGLKQFWEDTFPNYREGKTWNEIKQGFDNKISQILTGVLFYTFGQSQNSISMKDIITNSKVLLVNLSSKNLGEEGMSLLGAMLMSKAWFEAKKIDINQRNPFVVYADEFQNFATPDFATALSEARKFKLELILAHQYFNQLPKEVFDAVIGNVKSRVYYRAGVEDAMLIINEMQGKVLKEEIMEMPEFNSILKVGEDLMTVKVLKEADDINSDDYIENVIERNYDKYGMDKKQIVEQINKRLEWLSGGLQPVD